MSGSVKIIAAMSKNKVIGFNNKIPWKVPDEMKHFKETTMSNIVVMGRKTYHSVGFLPNRLNMVLTKDTSLYSNDFPMFLSCPEDCIDYAKNYDHSLYYKDADLYVIGGEQIYRVFEPYADEIILSEIPIEVEGDTYFPIDVKDESKWKLEHVEYRGTYTLRKYIKI